MRGTSLSLRFHHKSAARLVCKALRDVPWANLRPPVDARGGRDALEAACLRAIEINGLTYQSVNSILRNNLQRKNQVMDSTGVGLQNIKDRYRILTDRPVEIVVSQDHFTVLLPLLPATARQVAQV